LPLTTTPPPSLQLHMFLPMVEESGVEDLTIQFRFDKYAGHLVVSAWQGTADWSCSWR
jgi:hypothetical protein